MTAAELISIFESPEFRHDLQEISCYLASIMQERPIVYLVAKCLWRRRRDFELEKGHQDLCVDNRGIEFKFNYNAAGVLLEKELSRWQDLREMWAAVKSKAISATWGVMPRIYADVCDKKPDLFVWVICARDLVGLSTEQLERVCRSEAQGKYSDPDQRFLFHVDALLEKMKLIRPFTVSKLEIETKGTFPSVYHFRVCDYSTGVAL